MIINELLTNSFKYAFPGDKKGFVAVGLKKIGEKKLEMSVRDNGVGLPADLNINHLYTLGIQLVFQIACHQRHAKTDVTTKNGLHWRIVFSEDLYSDRIQP